MPATSSKYACPAATWLTATWPSSLGTPGPSPSRASSPPDRSHLIVACLNQAQANQTAGQCALHVDVRTAHRVRLTKRSRPAVLDLTPRPGGPLLNLTIYPGRSGTLPIVLDARERALLRRVRRLPLRITVTDYFTRARLAQADVTLRTRT